MKHGVEALVDSINSVQANLFQVILSRFWIPNLKTITGYTEVKLIAVASAKLLCESPSMLDPAAEELCGKLLDGVVTLLSLPEEGKVEDEQEVPDFEEATGYQATIVHLHNVGKKEGDKSRIQNTSQWLYSWFSLLNSVGDSHWLLLDTFLLLIKLHFSSYVIPTIFL